MEGGREEGRKRDGISVRKRGVNSNEIEDRVSAWRTKKLTSEYGVLGPCLILLKKLIYRPYVVCFFP